MALTTIKTGGLADNSVTDAKVADAITVTGAQTGITQVGTLTAGTWQGTAIASAYLDADTAHLSGTQTFSGAKTFSSDIAISTSSDPALTLTSAEAGTDDWKIYIAGTGLKFRNTTDSNTAFELTEDNNATFAGQLKIDTDQRYFTKWESTYGTDRDYWWRNDGGLLQLGEGAEGDAQVKYTFDTANSRLGIGLTSPAEILHLKRTTTNSNVILKYGNDERDWLLGVHGDDSDKFKLETHDKTDVIVIDSAGKVGIGISAMETMYGSTSALQVEGLTHSTAAVSIFRDSNDSAGAWLLLGSSRGTALNSDTIVQNGDNFGAIAFIGADGGDRDPVGAKIYAQVDGTPGVNDMPGRLIFATTSDGGNDATERMRITSDGDVLIGSAGGNENSIGHASYNNPSQRVEINGTWRDPQHGESGNAGDTGAIFRLAGGGHSNALDMGVFQTSPYSAWIQGTNRNTSNSDAGVYALILQPSGSNVGIGNFADGTAHTGIAPDHKLQVVKYGVTKNSDIHILQKWSTGFTGSEKGSNFGIGLNRWQEPGNNYPRTKATFYTTGRTDDSDALVTKVMSINDSGTFVTLGSHTPSGSPDYAEYFESKDGKAIPFGTTVKLDGDKVVPCESGDTPIGVISSDPSFIAGGAEFEWKQRWLVDDYGQKLIGEDGNEIENPDYDDTIEYIPRDEREEWNVVGIMGQLPVTKGQPISSSWIKMKDISETVELWFVK